MILICRSIIYTPHFIKAFVYILVNISNYIVGLKYINTLFSDPVITSVKGRGFRLNLEQYRIETIEHYINDYANKDSEILMNLGYRLYLCCLNMVIYQDTLNNLCYLF